MNLRTTAGGRLYWRLSAIRHTLSSMRRAPGQSFPLRHEFGWGWTVRDNQSWRRFPVVTPPLHSTRRIAAEDQRAAEDWGMERMGIS
ncbi:hypothetical protein ACIBCD_26785 [Nocardia brasiliensis]|uniref:hypothetical protein n=1 Tax=Nocardia brasiliensis TaxID=37326 RepID=UPI0037BA5663